MAGKANSNREICFRPDLQSLFLFVHNAISLTRNLTTSNVCSFQVRVWAVCKRPHVVNSCDYAASRRYATMNAKIYIAVAREGLVGQLSAIISQSLFSETNRSASRTESRTSLARGFQKFGKPPSLGHTMNFLQRCVSYKLFFVLSFVPLKIAFCGAHYISFSETLKKHDEDPWDWYSTELQHQNT